MADITMADTTADSVIERQSELMNKYIDAAGDAEAERDNLRKQVTRLQDKYEPANGVLVDQMLELSDNMSGSLLHVRVFTGEKMTMALVHRARVYSPNGVPNVPNWIFVPPVKDTDDHVLDISGYGTHEFTVSPTGGEDYCHDCFVQFDQNGVQLTAKTQNDNFASQLVITPYTPPPPVVLAAPDPGLETLYEVELIGTTKITFMTASIIGKQLTLEFIPTADAGDTWYFLPDGQDCQRKVFDGYGEHEVMFKAGKVCLVVFKPGTVCIMERGVEPTLRIRRPEMQPLIHIDERDEKRARVD
jgi:hypothetical protein